MKKGDISINIIIIAVIALVVLVLVVAIFTGRMGWFSKSIEEGVNLKLMEKRTLAYEKCQPSESDEKQYVSDLKLAAQNNDKASEDLAEKRFDERISTCGLHKDNKDACLAAGCRFKE